MSLEHSPARNTKKVPPGRAARDRWPLLLSVQDTAYELGLSTRRVYQLIATGELDSVKIRKARRVTSASMLRLAGERDEVE
jgi:excisionase family DNA binding protein